MTPEKPGNEGESQRPILTPSLGAPALYEDHMVLVSRSGNLYWIAHELQRRKDINLSVVYSSSNCLRQTCSGSNANQVLTLASDLFMALLDLEGSRELR